MCLQAGHNRDHCLDPLSFVSSCFHIRRSLNVQWSGLFTHSTSSFLPFRISCPSLVLVSSHFYPHFYSISTWCLLSNWSGNIKGFRTLALPERCCFSRCLPVRSTVTSEGTSPSRFWRLMHLKESRSSNQCNAIVVAQWWKSAFLVCLELVIVCGIELYDKKTQAVTQGKY